jgi:hypothetical protein
MAVQRFFRLKLFCPVITLTAFVVIAPPVSAQDSGDRVKDRFGVFGVEEPVSHPDYSKLLGYPKSNLTGNAISKATATAPAFEFRSHRIGDLLDVRYPEWRQGKRDLFKPGCEVERDEVRVISCEVERSLYSRAVGYSFMSEKQVMTRNGPQNIRYRQHIPPDVSAAMFYLKNRRPDRWRCCSPRAHRIAIRPHRRRRRASCPPDQTSTGPRSYRAIHYRHNAKGTRLDTSRKLVRSPANARNRGQA